eukprot:318219-Amphidinium_carterae.2
MSVRWGVRFAAVKMLPTPGQSQFTLLAFGDEASRFCPSEINCEARCHSANANSSYINCY